MKEHPLLLKGEMVRAVLRDENPKTQTRRIPTYRNTLVDGHSVEKEMWESFDFDFEKAFTSNASASGNPGVCLLVTGKAGGWTYTLQPKWNVGDRLWVRETFQLLHWSQDYESGSWEMEAYEGKLPDEHPGEPWKLTYDAGEDWCMCPESRGFVWRPSIYMTRWACRIELDIKDIRAERVQEISKEDIRAEGVVIPKMNPDSTDIPWDPWSCFEVLWDSINKKRGYGWDTNWPVWILEWPPYKGEQDV